MYGRPLGSVFCESFSSTCANQTHLAHYPDKYGNLELRYSSYVISPARLHIKLGKLWAAATRLASWMPGKQIDKSQ